MHTALSLLMRTSIRLLLIFNASCPMAPSKTTKKLEPMKDKGLIAYTYPQTTTADIARKHANSPFVWKRDDESYAVMQTWPTNYNDKFREEFACSTKNPNPQVFIPQAADEFKKTVVELFGQKADAQDILYCHKKSWNPKKVYAGTAGELQQLLRENDQVVRELDIIELTEDGFVCRTIDGKKVEGKKDFRFGDRDTKYALYTKIGWNEMACITPWSQFEKDRDMGECLGPFNAQQTQYYFTATGAELMQSTDAEVYIELLRHRNMQVPYAGMLLSREFIDV